MTDPDLPEWLATAMRAGAKLHLHVATLWVPDGGPPEARGPTDFVVDVAGGALTFLSARAQIFRRLDAAERDRLVELAWAAVGEDGAGGGVDTAVGRYMTDVALHVTDPKTGKLESRHFDINHYHSYREARSNAWPRFFAGLAEALDGAMADGDVRRFLFLLDRYPPRSVLDRTGFDAGLPVRVPDGARLVRLPLGPRLYLRAGQPPDPSCLIELRPAPPWGVEIVAREAPRSTPVDFVADRIPILRSPYLQLTELDAPIPRWTERDAVSYALEPLRDRPLTLAFPGGDEVLLSTGTSGPGIWVQRGRA